jgi:regulator of sigma E protease
MSMLQTLVAFLGALTLLIFVHEMGHFLVARACGVRVLRFSIGFGRPVFKWVDRKTGTEWVLALIPLGGYVRMLDERDPDYEGGIPAEQLNEAFSRKPVSARAAIVAAGPIANFLLAILLYAVLAWGGSEQPVAQLDGPPAASAAARSGLLAQDRIVAIDGRSLQSWNQLRLRMIDSVIGQDAVELTVLRDGGERQIVLATADLDPGAAERDFMRELGLNLAPGEVRVGRVVEGEPAQQAGLLAGDQVLQAEGQPVRRARDLIEQVQRSADRSIAILIRRGGDEISLRVTPAARSVGDGAEARKIGRIGAALQDRLQTERVRYGPIDGIVQGVAQTWEMTALSLRMLGRMLTGDLSFRNLSGPVTIADLAGDTARSGWVSYLGFLALISVSLGVLNLLPVPVLDGGHLVYHALEAARGRPLSESTMVITQKIGMSLVMLLMGVALFNDIVRLIGS